MKREEAKRLIEGQLSCRAGQEVCLSGDDLNESLIKEVQSSKITPAKAADQILHKCFMELY